MKYSIQTNHYKTFPLFEENKLPPRSYFIPFSNEEALSRSTCMTEREESDRVLLLSGDWNFKYYPHASAVPEVFDTRREEMDTVSVPSTWQRTGYEAPWYVNARYQFPLKPPYFPEDCPVGVYRKTFAIGDLEKEYILTFLGAISSLDVFLNGAYVGYSEGAHNSAEFDIKPYLTAGENELVAVVHKWSNGTYLECQDMFRENGIFRDVYITCLEPDYLFDFSIKTEKKGTAYDLDFTAQCRVGQGCEISISLHEGERVIARGSAKAEKETAVRLSALPVQEWSAEIPKVYELRITLAKEGTVLETIRNYTGFKTAEVQGEVFVFNGRPIKIKGVNHHDTDPKGGYVMTPEQMERDVLLMKEYNVNGVRMSHYPPDPIFLTLCDLHGLYVIDEADIETHGCYGGKRYAPNLLSNSPKWKNHFLDRVKRMVQRDKNHPSITMWSLGNESGGWKNQDACYEYVKQVSPIPVHYEAVVRTRRMAYDVISEMYTSLDRCGKIARGEVKKYAGKPFYLCEYAHAMGVGAGGLEEYMKLFLSSEKMMGGCIWEWADHAVYHAAGPYEYTYGGDHQEPIHDGNFCVDGLFFPDRQPHTGALNMKAAYRPIRCQKAGEGKYEFWNTQSFQSTEPFSIRWSLQSNGVEQDAGELALNLPPLTKTVVDLPHAAVNSGEDTYLTITYLDRESGRVAAKEQVELARVIKPLPETDEKAELDQSDGTVRVFFHNGIAVFNPKTGFLESYIQNGAEWFLQSPQGGKKGLAVELYRVPFDNDMYIRKKWEKLGYPQLEEQLRSFSAVQKGSKAEVTAEYLIGSKKKRNLFSAQLTYLVDGAGMVAVQAQLQRKKGCAKELPRFGVSLEMPKVCRQVEYFGRGEKENWSDFREHALVGRYTLPVSAMHEPYIKPQDSGNRSEVRWARVTDANGSGLEFLCDQHYFDFNANHFTVAQLAKWSHREDVKESETTVVHVDGFVRGAGSNACGEVPTREHRVPEEKRLSFRFAFRPVQK